MIFYKNFFGRCSGDEVRVRATCVVPYLKKNLQLSPAPSAAEPATAQTQVCLHLGEGRT